MKKYASKSSLDTAQKSLDPDDKIKALFVRAHALDQMTQYARLQSLAEARIKELEVLKRRKEERLKKEEISRGKGVTMVTKEKDDKPKRKIGEAYCIKELIQELNEFDERIQREEEKRALAREMTISKLGTAKGVEKKQIITTDSLSSCD
ncbi:hypothetical protein Btru_021551 [Bulinus truncatus]|nr:hypothetical protein Btru_021551 [Bulinus truncatus]